MKRFFIFSLLLINACSGRSLPENDCPPINIPRETARLYQNDQVSDKFQVNVVGYESYCYTDFSDKHRYAVITPLFKIRRLEESNTNKLDSSFYIKTSGAKDDFIGSQNYQQQLSIPSGVKEQTIKGAQTTTRIPTLPDENFSISLGFAMSSNQGNRAKKMFDIDYKFLNEEEAAAQSESAIEKVYLEVRSDEEVIYSECSGKPSVVKKNRNKGKCGN